MRDAKHLRGSRPAPDAPAPESTAPGGSRESSRREFIRVAGLAVGAAGWGLWLSACDSGSGRPAPDSGAPPADAGGPDGAAPDAGPPPDASAPDTGPPEVPPFDLPTLGGAPDTPHGRAIAAFCDTVVPGRHRDPTGAPGAIDAGAPALFFDPELPAAPLVPLLVLVLDAKARELRRTLFERLTPAERDDALAQILEEADVMAFAVQLAQLAYFSSAVGGEHLGYPGANPGYVDHPDLSFGGPQSRERTTDGNL